ncbi:hypothetical protein Tco_1276372 [Tanacetum coccineum]
MAVKKTAWFQAMQDEIHEFDRLEVWELALSIENGSLFEGESKFDKLKIYLITLVSIRSDWEDLPWLFKSVENLNTMAEQNVPAQAPTRTDEQIVPRSQWLQIGKSNLLFDAQKIQKNPIFQISVDILRIRASKQPEPTTKRALPKKPPTTTPIKPTKPPSSKQPKSPSKKPSKRKLLQKVRKGKPSFQLVDEDDEALQELVPQGEELDPSFLPQGQAPVGGVAIRDPVSETTPKLPEVVGKGKAIVTEEQVAHSLIDLSKKKRTTDQFILVRRDQAPHDSTTGPSSQPEDDTSEKVVHESSSTTDSERTESGTEAAAPKGDKEQGEVASSTVTSGVGISVPYPKVHENLKLITDEHVIEDNPESHSGSMSSMKNLEDTDNFGDQFLNDKPTEDDQEKSKVVDESDSTIPDPSHQTVTSTPPVIAPVIDFSSPKPSSQVTTPPITTEATSITTTLPEITPFIALQLRVAKLEQDMSEVKKTDHSAAALASIKS